MIKPRDLLLHLCLKYDGEWEKIYEAIRRKEHVEYDEVMQSASKISTNFLVITDDEYPLNFKRKLGQPPLILFYKGDVSLLNTTKYKRLSVVGSRKSTRYGEEAVKKIIKELPKDYVIVSGLAYGIDTVAHKTALECGLKTIAVLGSGIDYVYPEINLTLYNDILLNGGLILSEYPNALKPKKENFVFRNRIVAAIGNFLLVGEAYERSGTSSTITYALACGNSVGCIPYPITTNSMCNTYIKEGAYLIDSGNEVVSIMKNEGGSY